MKKIKSIILFMMIFGSIFVFNQDNQVISVEAEESGLQAELTDYLDQLKQANNRWADRLDTLLDKPLPDSSQIVDDNFSTDQYHPVIQAMYNMFYMAYKDYFAGEPSVGMMRDLYSDTFVFEKLVLPEFSTKDSEALDQLREWLTVITYEFYHSLREDHFVTAAYAKNNLNFAKQLADVDQFTDTEFHDSNMIALNTGVASEAYNTFLNEDFDAMQYVPFEANWFVHEVNPMASDVGSARISAYDAASQEVWQGVPIATPIEPYPPIDYQTRYAVRFTSHYPGFSNRYSHQTNIDDNNQWNQNKAQQLANFMGSWGREMSQVYKEYTVDQPVNFYGAQIPTNLFSIYLDGCERQVGYQMDQDIQLLAVYSDTEDELNGLDERHLYLFVEDAGIPRVLIAVDGPDQAGLLHFKDTANQVLHDGFIEIYNQ